MNSSTLMQLSWQTVILPKLELYRLHINLILSHLVLFHFNSSHVISSPSSVTLQNDLRMAKEKARRKQAIIGRQEEELAARDSNLDCMQKEQASSSRQVEHMQEDNKALKVAVTLVCS